MSKLMQKTIHNTILEVLRGDITKIQVDAIVNAANSALCGGGGVDGAIHRAGGPAILAECRTFKGGCPTGQAVVTTAGNLPCRAVIHTVGPVWYGGQKGEADLLASAYRSSLQRALEGGFKSLAFPAISTGVYRFPLEQATQIALDTVVDFLRAHPDSLKRVVFVTFAERDDKLYCKALQALTASAENR